MKVRGEVKAGYIDLRIFYIEKTIKPMESDDALKRDSGQIEEKKA